MRKSTEAWKPSQNARSFPRFLERFGLASRRVQRLGRYPQIHTLNKNNNPFIQEKQFKERGGESLLGGRLFGREDISITVGFLRNGLGLPNIRRFDLVNSAHSEVDRQAGQDACTIRRITAGSQGVAARNERRPLDRIRTSESPRSEATPPIGGNIRLLAVQIKGSLSHILESRTLQSPTGSERALWSLHP